LTCLNEILVPHLKAIRWGGYTSVERAATAITARTALIGAASYGLETLKNHKG